MDYKEQIDRLRSEISELENSELAVELFDGLIADLLARAEAAEARCETLEKMVKEYQDTIVPGYRERAEKAERERDAAVEQLHGVCSACVHYTPYHNDGPCATCTHEVACFVPEKATDKWKWRGRKEE